MKKLLVAAIAILATIGASAQVSFWDGNQPEKRLTWGVRAGMNLSSLGGDAETDSKIGFKAGVSADINIVNSFAISTGLFYSMQGFEPKGDGYGMTAGYLNLPIYASYRLNFAEASQLQINFGPYLAYGLHGDDHYFDMVKRFDMGLGVGAGYTLKRWFLGIDYQFGLMDINDMGGDGTIKNNNFSVTIGYNF